MKSSGLRTFFTPRWLGAFGALIVLMVIFVLLGLWQFGVAQDEGNRAAVEEAGNRPRIPLTELTTPHQPFGADFSNRPVTVTGTYAAEGTIVVINRRLGDQSGSWVVTPLVTDSGTVAVLRGFAPGLASGEVLTPPTGTVTIEGTVGPSESPREGPTLPAPQARGVDLSHLVNHWPGDLYNLMVFASDEKPADSGIGSADTAAGLTRVPPPQLSTQLNLKNAAYAIQWWCFGVFAVWLWWKMFRAESEAQPDAGPSESGGGDGPPPRGPFPDPEPTQPVTSVKEEAPA